ncbi:Protein mak16 [Durusdinium trenchii]|uniref:Protein mak16 n=1 Tax=Durusdinium trenchii TaxID=1381693 RepID=A0ABP0SHP3_9DINO
MAFDEALWQSLQQCKFRTVKEAPSESWCCHEYNATGLCNRSSCPLANSHYATVVKDGAHYCLCQKTPTTSWTTVKLCKSLAAAPRRLDQLLEASPEVLARAHVRLRSLQRAHGSEALVGEAGGHEPLRKVAVNKKADKRENKSERKAEETAKVESSVGQELLRRLRQGLYAPKMAARCNEELPREIEDLNAAGTAGPHGSRAMELKRKQREVEYELESTRS